MEGQGKTIGSVAMDWLSKGFDVIREGGRQYISEREEQAAFDEYRRGIDRAVAALTDVSQDKAAIAKALHAHWGVDYEEAEKRVQYEMRVNAPCRRLIRYLQDEMNYTEAEAKDYIRKSQAKILLNHEPKLSTMKAKDFYRELEKR